MVIIIIFKIYYNFINIYTAVNTMNYVSHTKIYKLVILFIIMFLKFKLSYNIVCLKKRHLYMLLIKLIQKAFDLEFIGVNS